MKPNGRSGSGAEISIDRTAPIGTINLLGSSSLVAVRREREEPEAGIRARRLERVTRPVDELDAHLRLLELVLGRERRDHAREPAHELVERARPHRVSRHGPTST